MGAADCWVVAAVCSDAGVEANHAATAKMPTLKIRRSRWKEPPGILTKSRIANLDSASGFRTALRDVRGTCLESGRATRRLRGAALLHLFFQLSPLLGRQHLARFHPGRLADFAELGLLVEVRKRRIGLDGIGLGLCVFVDFLDLR